MLKRLFYIICNIILTIIFFPLLLVSVFVLPITFAIAISGYIFVGEFKPTVHFDTWLEFAMSPCLIIFITWCNFSMKLDDILDNIN